MAVTMGFVLRLDSYPVAVAIPPLQQPMRPLSPVIEAQKITEPTSTMRSNNPRNALSHYAGTMASGEASALTYSAKGSAQGSALRESGRLLDTYA